MAEPLSVKEIELTSTTGETYTEMAGMSITPAAGKYSVVFSASVSSSSSDANCSFGIFVGNTEQLDAARKVFGDDDGRAPNLKLAVFTQTDVEMDGIKSLTVRWKTDKGVFRAYSRNLYLYPIK